MIKKVVFKNMNTSLSNLGIGDIRFYDGANKVIKSGNIITDTNLIGETDNFRCEVTGSAIGYYPISLINTSTNDSYWISDSNSNISVEIYFKKLVDSISKISFIPLPSNLTSIGISGNFSIEVYGYDDKVIHEYTVTTITNRNKTQYIPTYELSKYYDINNNGTIVTTDSTRLNNVSTIIKVDLEYDLNDKCDIRFLFSTDNKSTWFTVKNNVETTVAEPDILSDGMTISDMKSILGYDFSSVSNLDILCAIKSADIHHTPILHKLKIYYY